MLEFLPSLGETRCHTLGSLLSGAAGGAQLLADGVPRVRAGTRGEQQRDRYAERSSEQERPEITRTLLDDDIRRVILIGVIPCHTCPHPKTLPPTHPVVYPGRRIRRP